MISIIVISKDEPALDSTLRAVSAQAAELSEKTEILVVDSSDQRLDWVRERHPDIRWIDFDRPPGVHVSIPHQRNAGIAASSGDVIVFTDAGCEPQPGWLRRLVAPLLDEAEVVTAGPARSANPAFEPNSIELERVNATPYLAHAPTINLAFTRAVVERVGRFDETFEYGSDLDFSWRLVDAGMRIRSVPGAAVTHDWGTSRRRLKRAYQYGQAKARLYAKHTRRRRRILVDDPVTVVYPIFILGLPLTTVAPAYPLLLALPAWRARGRHPARVIADHILNGLGVLSFLARIDR